MQCEYIHQPLGIDVQHPRFMWQIVAPAAVKQVSYNISVASLKENLQNGKADHVFHFTTDNPNTR